MHFKKSAYLFGFLLALTGAFLAYLILKSSPRDREIYHRLMENKSDKIQGQPIATQKRGSSAKTLLLSEKGIRKIGYLTSQSSEISYEGQKEGGFVEKMEKVVLLYQEQFIDQGQIVLLLEAPKATYYYRQEKFEADQATFKRYILNGFELPFAFPQAPPFFEGKADRAVVILKHETPEFDFYRFFATFEPGKRIPFYEFEVEEIHLENKNLQLRNLVRWTHPLGQLKADWGEVKFIDFDQKTITDSILLKGDVGIVLKNGSEIHAAAAFLEKGEKRAHFEGKGENKVHYKGARNPKDGKVAEKRFPSLNETPISLKSLSLDFKFSGEEDRNPKIHEVIADGKVEIDRGAFHLEGDRAFFYDFDSEGSFSKVRVDNQNGKSDCLLKNQRGDWIQAASIDFDINNRFSYLNATHGVINRNAQSLTFTASALEVDEKLNSMLLAPPVTLEGLGKWESLAAITLYRDSDGSLQSISSEGPAHFYVKDSKQGVEHLLKTPGAVFIDHRKGTMHMKGLRDKEKNYPVHFEDPFGEIDADEAILSYSYLEGKFTPLRLLLKGDVKVENRSPLARQYALADEAEFFFISNTLTLRAENKSRVLLYDALNKMQASAPILEIKRDPATGKDSFQGVGPVRFIFAEEEFEELKRRFLFDGK